MRDDDPTEVLAPAAVESDGNGAAPAGAASSVWQVLRERREQLAADRHLDLEVPGAGGLLALRLGPISGQQQARLSDRVQKSKSPDRDFNLNADYLIAATRGILGREHPGDPLEMQVDDDDEPLRFDYRLAAKLGLPERTTARGLVRYLFGFAPSPELAVTIAGGEYVSWAGAASGELDEELLGEA